VNYDKAHDELKQVMDKRTKVVAKHRDYKSKIEEDMKEIEQKEQK